MSKNKLTDYVNFPLQICKKGGEWTLVGFVDMGRDLADLECVLHGREAKKLATHVLQLTFAGFSGFRWPVAYFGTRTASAYQLHSIFWQAIDILGQYGFSIDYCNLDGATTNRAFMKMLISQEQLSRNDFTVTDIFDPMHKIVIIQDIKHVFKKMRNSMYSSKLENKEKDESLSARYILLDGKPVVWNTVEEACKYNYKFGIRIHPKLSHEAVYLTSANKMRNALAEQVLHRNMLKLLKAYKASSGDDHGTTGMIKLVEYTSKLVDIFSDMRHIKTLNDQRISCVKECATFFCEWEREVLQNKDIAKKSKYRYLFTEQTLEDIRSSLYGFVSLCELTLAKNIDIVPGLLNSDIIENLFCQQRGICHGSNTNPTLLQYGPAINAIILSQCSVSKKNNTGSGAQYFKALVPGKLKKNKGKMPRL